MTVNIAGSEQLGNDVAMLTSLRTGALDITANSQGAASGLVPELATLGLPFLFEDSAAAFKVLDGPVGDELADERALRRLAKLGDGWFPQMGPDEKCQAAIEKIRAYAKEAGRDPDQIGIEGRMHYDKGSAETWVKELEAWKKLGATHVSLNTMKAGLTSPVAHIEAIRRFQKATAASW